MREIEPAYRMAIDSRLGKVSSDVANETLRSAMGNSIIALQEFFTRFRWYMEDAEADRRTFVSSALPIAQQMFDRETSVAIKHRRYSDGLMVFSSVQPGKTHAPVMALLRMIGLCGHMTLEQLAAGQPVRGGLDLGIGVIVNAEFDHEASEELLGPSVVGAYELESEKAHWSRVAVGTGLQPFLDAVLTDEGAQHLGTVGQAVAAKIKDMIFVHDDGTSMLDILGKAYAQVFGKRNVETVSRALSFVKQQVTLWSSSGTEDGNKLATRYAALSEYIERRRYIWA
jgi:hypothetical protein